MSRKNRGELFHEILGIAEAAVDACEANERDFVEATKALHAEVSDVFGSDFSLVMIQHVDFDLDSHLLNIFWFNFSFPASLREATFYLRTAKVLASSVPFTDLKKTFDTFVGGETSLAVIAISSAANRTSVFDVT